MSYRVIEQLGRGGFGVVEKVVDDQGFFFAKKRLLIEAFAQNAVIDEAQLRRRFDREVRYQTAITHPNVAKIFYHDTAAKEPYCIMELAEETLKNSLDRDRTLGAGQELKKALFDILSGLEAIHRAGYKHRDLKPENVLVFLEPDGQRRYAISDFGLVAGVNSQTTTLTATGVGGGTAYYAAPECATGLHKAVEASDIYSFGAILHDIFGGGQSRVPHTKLSVPDTNISLVVERCTEKNPHRRYRNVAQLREALFLVLSADIVFSSSEEQQAVELLKEKSQLTDDEWDIVCLCLEGENRQANENIFFFLTQDHIKALQTNSEPVFNAIGYMFCEFVNMKEGRLDFGYCDILAAKLYAFWESGDLSLKATVLIALMVMGASHNRWYVERLFWNLITAPDVDPHLINRFLVELDIKQLRFSPYIEHILVSIGVVKDALPVAIRGKLEQEKALCE